MEVLLTRKAAKELDKIPNALARKIVNDLKKLSANPLPPNSKKLKGRHNYHLRIGSYRAIYTVDTKHKQITILRIAHRQTIYRNF